MKYVLSLLVLMATTLTVSFAQTPAATTTPTTPAAEAAPAAADGPIMTFDSETIDYGVIEQGSDPYRVFTFKNTGSTPLIIKHAKGSCGCTVPSYEKEPIEPGKSSEVKVRYDTKRLGKFTKRVTLTTNAGDEKKVLTIKGEVIKKPEEPAGVPASSPSLFNNGNSGR